MSWSILLYWHFICTNNDRYLLHAWLDKDYSSPSMSNEYRCVKFTDMLSWTGENVHNYYRCLWFTVYSWRNHMWNTSLWFIKFRDSLSILIRPKYVLALNPNNMMKLTVSKSSKPIYIYFPDQRRNWRLLRLLEVCVWSAWVYLQTGFVYETGEVSRRDWNVGHGREGQHTLENFIHLYPLAILGQRVLP